MYVAVLYTEETTFDYNLFNWICIENKELCSTSDSFVFDLCAWPGSRNAQQKVAIVFDDYVLLSSNLKTSNLLKSYYTNDRRVEFVFEQSSIPLCWKVIFLENYWPRPCLCNIKFSFKFNLCIYGFASLFLFLFCKSVALSIISSLSEFNERCTSERVLPHPEGHEQ